MTKTTTIKKLDHATPFGYSSWRSDLADNFATIELPSDFEFKNMYSALDLIGDTPLGPPVLADFLPVATAATTAATTAAATADAVVPATAAISAPATAAISAKDLAAAKSKLQRATIVYLNIEAKMKQILKESVDEDLKFLITEGTNYSLPGIRGSPKPD